MLGNTLLLASQEVSESKLRGGALDHRRPLEDHHADDYHYQHHHNGTQQQSLTAATLTHPAAES